MSKINPQPAEPHAPILSESMTDLEIVSIQVVHDPESAKLWGAFEETALDIDEAWAANGDLDLS